MSWTTLKTRHYIFYFHKNSIAARDIEKIAEIQENCHERICSVLKVEMNRIIEYYLCDSPEEVGEFYGDGEPTNGFARFPNKIYAVYNKDIKCIGCHEDAHLISYNAIAKPENALISEGIAMFFDETWWGLPNSAWVKVFVEIGLYRSLAELKENKNFYRYPDVITYPISGVFVKHLILSYSIEKFKMFYKTVDSGFDRVFFHVFGMKLYEFEERMKKYVQTLNYSNKIHDDILSLLRNSRLLNKDT